MIKNAKPILLAVLLIEAVLIGGQQIEARLLKNKIGESLQNVQGVSTSSKSTSYPYYYYTPPKPVVPVKPYVYYNPPKPIIEPPKPYVYYTPKPPVTPPIRPYIYNNFFTNQAADHKIQIKPLQEITSGINTKFAKSLAGRFLLQVEQKGALWYVDAIENKRHLITLDNAIAVFKNHATGIADAELVKIPAVTAGIQGNVDTDGDGYSDLEETIHNYSPYNPQPVKIVYDNKLAKRFAGSFLMQVEQSGTIWYVDKSGRRHVIRADTLIDFLNSNALGISDKDLSKIPLE